MRAHDKRVYWTNSLYSTWDKQFYPAGVPGRSERRRSFPLGLVLPPTLFSRADEIE